MSGVNTIPTAEDFRTEFKRDVKSSDLDAIVRGGPKTEKGGIDAEKGGIEKGGIDTIRWEKPEGVHLRIKIAEMLSTGAARTTDQLASRLGRARSTIIKHLVRMREIGVIRYVGANRWGHWEICGNEQGGAR